MKSSPHSKIRWQLIRFVFGGGISAALGYMIYLICLVWMSYPAAYSISFFANVVISYFVNAQLVFRGRPTWANALAYPVIYVLQYFIGFVLLYGLVEFGHVNSRLAPILGLLLTVPFTFAATRCIMTGRLSKRGDD